MSVTGNDERDRMIFQAMNAAASRDETLSLDKVKAYLPDDFDLLPGELVACRHAAKLEPAPLIPTPLVLPDNTAPEPLPEPQAQAAPEPEARLTQAEARRAVETAAKRLDLARLAMRQARAALDVQRGKLGKAIEAWQNGGPRWTDAMERAAMRASYAANKGHGPRMNTRKHPAQAVIEGRGVVSGFKGSHRNGLPSEYQHRNVNASGMFQGTQAKKI